VDICEAENPSFPSSWMASCRAGIISAHSGIDHGKKIEILSFRYSIKKAIALGILENGRILPIAGYALRKS